MTGIFYSLTCLFYSYSIYFHNLAGPPELRLAHALLHIAKEDNNSSFTEAVMRDIISKPHWAPHPELVFSAINHSANMNKVLI